MSNATDYTHIVAYRMYEVGYTHIEFHKARSGLNITATDPYIRKVAVVCRYNEQRPVHSGAVREAMELKERENCSWAIVASHNGYTDEARALAKENNVMLWKV